MQDGDRIRIGRVRSRFPEKRMDFGLLRHGRIEYRIEEVIVRKDWLFKGVDIMVTPRYNRYSSIVQLIIHKYS